VTIRSARRIPALGLALALALAATTRADDPKKPADDLPEGAKLRLGEARLVFRFSLSLSLLPPDYKAIALAEGDGTLRRVDVATGRPLDDRKEPAGGLYGNYPVVTSADGKRFVSTQAGALTVRESDTGKVVKALQAPAGFGTAFVVSQPVASLSADGKVFAHGGTGMNNKSAVAVWDVEKGEILFQTGLPTAGPGIPLLSPDGKLVAVRGSGFGAPTPKIVPGETPKYAVTVFEVAGGKELLRAQATAGPSPVVATAAFSPDGSLLATAASDGLVEVWDVKADKLKAQLLGRGGQGARLAYSPDGKTLAAVATDGAIQRWDADGKPAGKATEGPAPGVVVQGLAFADNERAVAWGMAGPCPVVWEAPSGKMISPAPDHTGAINSIAFAAGGKEVVTSGLDNRVFRWDAATGKRIAEVTLRPARNLTGGTFRLPVFVSPDGTRAVSTGVPVAVFDLATGAEEFALPRGQFANFVTTAIPSADATKLVVLSSPFDRTKTGKCAVWDLVARQQMIEAELEIAPGFPPTAAVSPSGKRLVTVTHKLDAPNAQPTLLVTGWDPKTGKKLGQVEEQKVRGSVFVAAADDTLAVVSFSSGRLKVYDYATGKSGEDFEAGKERGEPVAGPVVFSPDGKRFASAVPAEQTNTYAVKVREWPSGKVQHTFTGFRAPVSAITFSPDGKTLATGSQDTTVLLWDVGEKKQ
jgi:WD40 repeat protein